VSNTAANGGRLSINQIVTSVRNNLFPDVTEAERTAGLTRYRKLFLKVVNTDNEMLANAIIHLLTVTPADDYITMFEGTHVDTQANISSPTEYGAGVLAGAEIAGAESFDVNVKHTDMIIFRTGDRIYISDGVNEEYHDNVTISKSGTVVTITLDTGSQLANGYAAGSVVASCIDVGDVDYDIEDFNVVSASGTYDETDNIIVDNIGGIHQTWTLTFTGVSNFDCAGSIVGAVGSGSINSNYSPTNTNFARPYFTLNSAGFGGTWAEGDTVVFTTIPRNVPIWFKKVVPALSASYSGNNFDFRILGETA
jgi:hypothetical protein